MNEVGKKNIFNNREIWIKKDFFYYFISFFFLQKRFKDSCFSYYTCYIYINIDTKNNFCDCVCAKIFLLIFFLLLCYPQLWKKENSPLSKKTENYLARKTWKNEKYTEKQNFSTRKLKKNFFDKEKNRLNKRI